MVQEAGSVSGQSPDGDPLDIPEAFAPRPLSVPPTRERGLAYRMPGPDNG